MQRVAGGVMCCSVNYTHVKANGDGEEEGGEGAFLMDAATHVEL